MRYSILLIGFVFLLSSLAIQPTETIATTGLPSGFVEDPPITGFNGAPIAFAWTPDGRLFVNEQTGALRVVKNGALLDTPAITLNVTSNSERGLLGIVFDPQFASNNYVYLYYTTGPGALNYGGQPNNRISRFTVSGDTVVAGSELVLLDNVPVTAGNHNGGDLRFGPDGWLYASTGDGADRTKARNLDSLFGKILRIDPATGRGVPGNPFYSNGASSNRARVWAYGLRNPYRFDIQPGSGLMYIADVGEQTYEELDEGVAGADYGWPQVEGPSPPNVSGVTYPVFWYGRSGNPNASFDNCRSIIGGGFVRGTNFPADYRDQYFFADYGCERIWSMRPGQAPTLFASEVGTPSHLAFSPDGMLYFSEYRSGSVRRIRYTSGNRPPTAEGSANVTAGPLPLTVNFSSSGSSDPDGDPITYRWDFGDNTSATQANPQHVYQNSGTYTVVLTVTDSKNASTNATPITIRAGANPPQVKITAPTNGARLRADTPMTLQGSATDIEDGPLAGSQLRWQLFRHHGTSHTHPWGTGTGASFNTTMPTPEDLTSAGTSFLEVRLTATDSSGASATDTIQLYPQTVQLTFATNPPGLKLVLDGQTYTAPATVVSAKGWSFSAGANPQSRGICQNYAWSRWSDGGAASHTVVTPESDRNPFLTATFTALTRCSYLPVGQR